MKKVMTATVKKPMSTKKVMVVKPKGGKSKKAC